MNMKDNKSFMDFMNEEKSINRWAVLVIGLTGGFSGALLMLMVALLGFI